MGFRQWVKFWAALCVLAGLGLVIGAVYLMVLFVMKALEGAL